MTNPLTVDKKLRAQIEAKIEDANERTKLMDLEGELIDVEEFDAVGIARTNDDNTAAATIADAEQAAAEIRANYVNRFTVTDRLTAIWAARKITEAKGEVERLKETMKREVHRAETRLERREEFFKAKLREWAETQKHEGGKNSVYHIVRLPEASARLEVRPKPSEGVEILDEKLLLESLRKELGTLGLADLVKTEERLVIEKVRAYLDEHKEFVPKLDGVIERKKSDEKSLVIVRM